MRSSAIGPVITTLLLAGYIAFYAYFLINLKTVDSGYPAYEECVSSRCGNSIIQYPFGKCGLLYSDCRYNQIYLSVRSYSSSFSGTTSSFSGTVVGDITNSSYSTSRTLQVAPTRITPFLGSKLQIRDFSAQYDWLITGGFFNLSKGYIKGTIVNCTQRQDLTAITTTISNSTRLVDCRESNSHCIFFPKTGLCFDNCICYTLIIPDNNNYNITADKNFKQLQQIGFQITWSVPEDCDSCVAIGGKCYSQWEGFYFIDEYRKSYYDDYCICANVEVHSRNCSNDEDLRGKISLPATAVLFFMQCAAFTIVVVSCISFHRGCCCKRSASDEEQTILEFMEPVDSTTPSVENFLHYYSSQVQPTRYSYSHISAFTNNLAEQLGKGGFGTVYKGRLPSGRMIAVKMLDESKQSEQQFIAEVATVGSTYHVNLVRMLGYCSDGSKKALVYEYMINRSLEKYIHGNHQDQLDWKQLCSIAIGTARGILYLHEECRNRILHCDIKPHNVLLDANFLPKVADFGLAKISKREATHVSAAHGGTLGYAAPEMWSRMYGPVTDKSDVYSYGMLIMEMVGGRKNIDLDNIESRSSKFFYAEWAYKQVEKGDFGNMRKGNISEEDQSIAKKLSLIGLWCIQFHASRRPGMSKVIQMLEGEVEIATPPFPFPVDTPPITQPSSSDQSAPSADHCSSSYAPKSIVGTPSSVQRSSDQSSSSNQCSSSYALTPPTVPLSDQSSSSNQCSSSYALEIQMIDPKMT